MPLTVNDIIHLYDDRGEAWYGGEAVTQRQHALQCAWLAERDGGTPALIVACLLHDLGHLVHDLGEDAADRGLDDAHELRAAKELSHLFPPAVLGPIRLHVTAKRHLCLSEPGYLDALSPASRQSLELQGGPLTEGQAAVFLSVPWAEDAIRLRRYDDEAKVRNAPTPDLEHFRPLVSRMSFSTGRRMAAGVRA
jgi:phosphonate degradation associated HDIG domain protein